jgi:hypothetical protein
MFMSNRYTRGDDSAADHLIIIGPDGAEVRSVDPPPVAVGITKTPGLSPPVPIYILTEKQERKP